MAAQAAVSRILFAMARDGKLPAFLAKVHPRYKTPYMSTLAVAVISLLVGLLFANRLDDLSRVVNFGALTGFVLLHLSVINHYFYRRRSGDWLRHVVFPLTGLAIIVYVLYEMDRSGSAMGEYDGNVDFVANEVTSAFPSGVTSSPAYFNGFVYYAAIGDSLKTFNDAMMDNGMPPVGLMREILLKDKSKWGDTL